MRRERRLIMPLPAGLCGMVGCPPPATRPDPRASPEFDASRRARLVVPGQPRFESGAVFPAIDGRIGSHAPTITTFADGEILAAWYSYQGPGELEGSAIYTARRPVGATAWEPPALHIDRGEPEGNPVLYSEGDSVWFFTAVAPFGWSTAHIEVQRSADRGRNWTAPVPIAGPLGSNVRFPPLRTTDGELLLPAYDDLWLRSLFFVSRDGVDWTLRSIIETTSPFRNLQPCLAAGAGGRILAVMRNSGRQFLWVTVSNNGGRSWATPINSGFANPASPACLLRLTSGRLLLVFNDSATHRRPLSACLSADDGQRWTTPRVLVDGPGEYAYPAAVQAPDGAVHVLYSNNRENIGHLVFNEAWVSAGT